MALLIGAAISNSTADDAPLWAMWLFSFPVMAVGAGHELQYSLAEPADQKRLLWIVEGVALGVGISILVVSAFFFGPASWLEWGSRLASAGDVSTFLLVAAAPFFVFTLGGICMATFSTGALDPRLAIRKTTVYGVLGVLFIVLFAVVESLVSELLEARLGLPSMLGAAFSGAVVALIVIPLRGRFSRWMDRWMPDAKKAVGEVQSSDLV